MFPLDYKEPYIESTGRRSTLGEMFDDAGQNINQLEHDVDELKRSLSDLEDTSETTKTVDYTNIITIDDASAVDAQDVKVKVDAIQDLHGYTKPWVGGAGKNKLFGTFSDSRASHQFTDSTGTIKVTATSGDGSAQTVITLANLTPLLGQTVTFSIDSYEVSNNSFKPYVCFYKNGATGINGDLGAAGQGITRTSVTFTIPSDSTSLVLLVRVDQNDTQSSGAYLTLKGCQLEIGSSKTSFAPYTNICPITGHSEVKVTRAGKNLFDFEGWLKTNNVSYTKNGNSYTLTSALSAFEPFEALDTFTIDLDGTRYGGVLDVDAGTLTLTHGEVDLGSLSWEYITNDETPYYRANVTGRKTGSFGLKSSAFERSSVSGTDNLANGQMIGSSTGSYIFIRLDSITNAATFTTFVTGEELVYELATPQTITLSPTHMQLLLNYNTIFADTGDTSLTYIPNDSLGGIGAAIGSLAEKINDLTDSKLDVTTLKSIVADSADFAAFKTAIAAL